MEDNRLETISKDLKAFLARYNTQSALGHLSFLMTCITNGSAQDELGMLVSPMRQLYYLAGLLVSQDSDGTNDYQYSEEDWQKIVGYLVEIENEYYKLFLPENPEDVTEEWKKKVGTAMPTFLSYFNLGPLNFEEQVIEQIRGTFSALDDVIGAKTGLATEDYLQFYENLDAWCEYNFQSLGIGGPQYPLRKNWREYTALGEIDSVETAPGEIQRIGREKQSLYTLVIDPGIKYRFKDEDMVSNGLTIDKVNTILSQLAIKRETTDFLYYTGQNPLVLRPIVDLENGLYQVFEEKRVLHAIYFLLEEICKEKDASKARLTHCKGHYLEGKIVELCRKFFGEKAEIVTSYFVDGCEQDIMVLWSGHLFVIEAKAYSNREPFRNAEKAFVRIKDDFNGCVGYAYKQCKRVEDKMREGKPFDLKDEKGKVIKTIYPEEYDGNDFYIIVNQESFGQIQVDLSMFLEIWGEENYPWAVRFDDLEMFLLTLIAKKEEAAVFCGLLDNERIFAWTYHLF